MGMIYKRGRVYWIKFFREGTPHRESVRGALLGDEQIATGFKEGEAKRLLKLREGNVERGVPVSPKIGRLMFAEAMADVVSDYRTNAKRSLPDLEQRVRDHLAPYFGGRRMSTITTTDLRAYITHRQAENEKRSERHHQSRIGDREARIRPCDAGGQAPCPSAHPDAQRVERPDRVL
jgi:hypothetical protein